jgi:hypothetical protein
MTVISQLEKGQGEKIPHYIEKWQAKCTLTTPIIPALFEQGLQDIHEELGMEIPREYLYYPSPTAMWRDVEVWKPKITRVLTQFWSYQIPLCDPFSYHRQYTPVSKRPAFNFAAKRYSPGPKYALCETEDSNETSGTVIEKEFHSQLWKLFDFQAPIDWEELGYYYTSGNFETPDYFEYIAQEEDLTNQAHYRDYCLLAPQPWLLHELACVDFSHHVLGINRNERLYAGLEAIVENGSFCGVFGRLCVACERPAKIELKNKSFKLTFRDDEVFSYEE